MSFAAALAFTLIEEGGYSNDPADPGGPTNFGITLATLHEWRSALVTAADVRELSRDEAEAIYRFRYWSPYRCPEIPVGLDLLLFDSLVNPGQTWTVKTLQRLVAVAVDGFVGPITLAAVRGVYPASLIGSLSSMREQHYRTRPGFPRFGKDWLARTARAKAAALAGSTGQPGR